MSEFKIEKGVPAPVGTGRTKYPFWQMEVGDSFFVPLGDRTVQQIENVLGGCTRAARSKGKKFTTRKDGDGVRCWRIA